MGSTVPMAGPGQNVAAASIGGLEHLVDGPALDLAVVHPEARGSALEREAAERVGVGLLLVEAPLERPAAPAAGDGEQLVDRGGGGQVAGAVAIAERVRLVHDLGGGVGVVRLGRHAQ